jgi:hypothetical protein
MEILRPGEILAEQGRADHLAVPLDQAAVGLMRKGDLGDAGHGQGIGKTGEHGHGQDHDDGGSNFSQHCPVLTQGRWR